MNDKETRVRSIASTLLREFKDTAAIDTANYLECGFIIAAAELCVVDYAFARAVGKHMEQAGLLDPVTDDGKSPPAAP